MLHPTKLSFCRLSWQPIACPILTKIPTYRKY